MFVLYLKSVAADSPLELVLCAVYHPVVVGVHLLALYRYEFPL